MDSTRSSKQVETEDQQAGVIRAIFRSPSNLKRAKDGLRPDKIVSAKKKRAADLAPESLPADRGEQH